MPTDVAPVDVAERVGFEPTDRVTTINALAGRPIRPLWHLSWGAAVYPGNLSGGTVAEWTIAAALKAAGRKARGFESLPFRRWTHLAPCVAGVFERSSSARTPEPSVVQTAVEPSGRRPSRRSPRPASRVASALDASAHDEVPVTGSAAGCADSWDGAGSGV